MHADECDFRLVDVVDVEGDPRDLKMVVDPANDGAGISRGESIVPGVGLADERSDRWPVSQDGADAPEEGAVPLPAQFVPDEPATEGTTGRLAKVEQIGSSRGCGFSIGRGQVARIPDANCVEPGQLGHLTIDVCCGTEGIADKQAAGKSARIGHGPQRRSSVLG